jgi:hypothetical protein
MDTEHASFQAEMQRAADRASTGTGLINFYLVILPFSTFGSHNYFVCTLTAERALGSEQQKSSHLQQQVAQLLDRVAHSEVLLFVFSSIFLC